MGESPPDAMERDYSAGPWQRTGVVGGGPAYSDDNLRGITSIEMEDWNSVVAGLL